MSVPDKLRAQFISGVQEFQEGLAESEALGCRLSTQPEYGVRAVDTITLNEDGTVELGFIDSPTSTTTVCTGLADPTWVKVKVTSQPARRIAVRTGEDQD